MLKLKKFFLYMTVAFIAIASFVSCDLLNGQERETKKYTVTYSTAQGTAPAQIEVDENTVLTAKQLPELTADGYLFGGWYDGETVAIAGTYAVTKDVTLVAKWEEKIEITASTFHGTYTGTWNIMGGSYPMTVIVGESTLYYSSSMMTGKYEYVAWFKDDNDNWVCGGSHKNNLTSISDAATTVTFNAETKKGSFSVVAMDFVAPAEITKTSDSTEVPATKYTVTYSTAQGTAPAQIEVDENTVLTAEQLPELSADGWVFSGWFDGETQAIAGTYVVTKNVTLKAKWTVKVEEVEDNSEHSKYYGTYSGEYTWTFLSFSGKSTATITVTENSITYYLGGGGGNVIRTPNYWFNDSDGNLVVAVKKSTNTSTSTYITVENYKNTNLCDLYLTFGSNTKFNFVDSNGPIDCTLTKLN